MQRADLAADLKAIGRLFFLTILLFSATIGDRPVTLPVFAALGFVRFWRLRGHAPDRPVDRALVGLLASTAAAGLLALATFVPGAPVDSLAVFAVVAVVVGCIAWALAMGRWASHLGRADVAARFRRATQALVVDLAAVIVSLSLLVALVDRGPVHPGGTTTRPSHFLGRPLDAPGSLVGFVAIGVPWIVGLVLLGKAFGPLRSALEGAAVLPEADA